MNVSPPNWSRLDSMSFCIALMAVITTIIENTPTNTPSKVSAERSLCAASALIAIRKLSFSSARKTLKALDREVRMPAFMANSFIAQGIHRIHPRGAPGGEESRRKPCQQRHHQCQPH